MPPQSSLMSKDVKIFNDNTRETRYFWPSVSTVQQCCDAGSKRGRVDVWRRDATPPPPPLISASLNSLSSIPPLSSLLSLSHIHPGPCWTAVTLLCVCFAATFPSVTTLISPPVLPWKNKKKKKPYNFNWNEYFTVNSPFLNNEKTDQCCQRFELLISDLLLCVVSFCLFICCISLAVAMA